jgi:hypothetical protein
MSTASYAVVVPVWGKAHVDRFLEWVLPSWLAPRNLPDLAERGETELVLLAPKEDLNQIENHRAILHLREICGLRLIEIDDLIPGAIGTVTLTLAFVRGAQAAIGQGSKRLIFLNADFVLADGSMASVARRFDAGQRVQLCSSIRVREELVAPDLEVLRKTDVVIAVAPRDAVRLALGALHPTALACRADQPLLHSSHPNQFFWRVDATSLLLRAFLLFPLAVEPETSPGPADTYCDYGWIGTFAPESSVNIIDSSDELFIIELAPTGQESAFVRTGVLDTVETARSISVWANEFSRVQPLTPVIFNAAEPPKKALEQTLGTSLGFIIDLLERLGPPKPLSNHPYWTAGAAAYLRNRKDDGIVSVPLELAVPPILPRETLALNSTLRSLAKKLLVGRPNKRRRWHPYWAVEQRIKALGELRVVGDAFIADRFNIPVRQKGTPIAGIDLRDLRKLDNCISILAAAVTSGGRAYLLVEQGNSGSNDLVYSNERINLFVQLDKLFRLVSERSLITWVEESAASTHRRLATDIQLASPVRTMALTLASASALLRVIWKNRRFEKENVAGPKDPVFVLELRRY